MGPEYDDEHADFIIDAMKAIENVSCISFKPATENITAYLNITSRESGCSAVVGYVNTNQQFNIRIGKLHSGCFVKGTIIHELLHALGFFHQHNSPNRDDYIKIVEENVKDGYMSKFNKNKDKDVTDFGVGYDYGSVMHYPAKAYSKNGKDTLIPLEDEKIEIGQRRGLSDKDIEKLNLMYECKKD